ncbi:MAG: glycosyltransferase [Lachnospiraceae bacterium]|nr:glycosyltransferase [Lachnospiraceae bacterium]
MKNVAILVQNLHNGGAERMAANLSIELSKNYKVYLFVFDASNAIYPYGGKLIDLKVPPLDKASASKRLSNVITRVRRLSYLKNKYHIDCTISHMDGANVVNILSRRNDKVICVYHSMPSMCEDDGLKTHALQRFIGAGADKYICVSKMAEADMAENYGVNAHKLGCIYNFADLGRIAALKKIAMPADAEEFYKRHEKIIITAGRLTHMKAQDRLIRLTGEIRGGGKNVGLVILGEGDERPLLEELAEELRIKEHVYMPGEVEDPFSYMEAASVFALTSDYEGLPMVLIEAAACALPVVSVDIPSGPREILSPGSDIHKLLKDRAEYAQYGVLVPSCADDERRGALSNNEKLMKEALMSLMYDTEVRKKYTDCSLSCAERFSSDKINRQWMDLIGI